MLDYAREEHGGRIVMASCVDDRHPPENMLNGKESMFWVTTGMFPQEFVLALDTVVKVSRIGLASLNVKKLAVESCGKDKPDTFDKVFEVELMNRGDRLQTELHQVNITAKYLRFTLHSGYGDFATINRVSVVGEAVAADDSNNNALSEKTEPLAAGAMQAAGGNDYNDNF